MASTCASPRTTIRRSWPDTLCGRSVRCKSRQPRAPSDESFDENRRDRDVEKAIDRVDHVVLAEIHDRQEHRRRPGEESDGEHTHPVPCVDGSQRRERGVERWECRELVWIQVRVERRNEVIRFPELVHRLVEDLVHDLRGWDVALLELIPGWC